MIYDDFEEFLKSKQKKQEEQKAEGISLSSFEDFLQKKKEQELTSPPSISLEEFIQANQQEPPEIKEKPSFFKDFLSGLRGRTPLDVLFGSPYAGIPDIKSVTAKAFGADFPTGRYEDIETGRQLYDLPTALLSSASVGLLRGATLNLPETITNLLGHPELTAFQPETTSKKLAYAFGDVVGFVYSPLTKAINIAMTTLSGKILTKPILTAKKEAVKTSLLFLKNLVDSSVSLGTAFAIQSPLGKTLNEDLKQRLDSFIRGAEVGTIFSGISLINPNFLSTIAPKRSILLPIINHKSSPFLFSILRGGIVSGADLINQGNIKNRDLTEILFNAGVSFYFGASTKFYPKEQLAGLKLQEAMKKSDNLKEALYQETIKEVEQLKQEHPDSKDELIKFEKEIVNPAFEKEQDKFFDYQTNYARPSKSKYIGQRKLDTRDEQKKNWDNHRHEVEHLTPKSTRVPILKDFKIRATKAGEEVTKSHNEFQGSTYNLYTGNKLFSDKYVVSLYPERSLAIKATPDLKITKEDAFDFINRNLDLLSNPSLSIRTWYSNKRKCIVFDVVAPFKDKAKAIAEADKNAQESIFYTGNKNIKGEIIAEPEEIYIGSQNKKLSKVPLQKRMLFSEKENPITLYHFSEIL